MGAGSWLGENGEELGVEIGNGWVHVQAALLPASEHEEAGVQLGLHHRLVAGLLGELEELEVGKSEVALPLGIGGVAGGEGL